MANSDLALSMGVIFAIASSFSYTGTLILLRKGMESGSSTAAILFIDIIVGTGGFIIAWYLGSFSIVSINQVFWFILSGFFGAGLGTITHFIGIQRIGVSRATPIHSASPIWAVLLAIFILGESPESIVIVGTSLIIAGVFLLSLPEKEDSGGFKGWLDSGCLYPLISSISYGLSPVFVKIAFSYGKVPFIGIGISFWVGLATMFFYKRFMEDGGKIIIDKRSFKLFTIAALFNLAASGFLWTAFSLGDLTIVLPLSRITPLWVVILSIFFLKKQEKVTIKTFAAAILIVAGGILVTSVT